MRYILSIPSNVTMIISSSLGYFFFSGLTTFALLFVRGHYGANALMSDLVLALMVGGALIGTLVSGWLGDLLLRRGMLTSRMWMPAVCYLGAAVLLIPGFVSTHLTPALWFDVAGAALISAANPPLDAARLDIMPAGLWGRRRVSVPSSGRWLRRSHHCYSVCSPRGSQASIHCRLRSARTPRRRRASATAMGWRSPS